MEKPHYRLLTPHLKELARFVESGGKLDRQEDVPLFIQQQLYTEEQQRRDRKSGRLKWVAGDSPAVTINVLHGHVNHHRHRVGS